MAELLILNRDATPEQRSYKRGDIVVVMPDGHQWGSAEGLPDFVRAHLPGVPIEAIEALRMAHQVPASESASVAVRAIRRLYDGYSRARDPDRITRRRYRVPVELLTPDADGYIALALNQIEDKKHAAQP